MDPEQEFAALIARKFGLFKDLVLDLFHEREPKLQISQEQARRLADYLKDSYFKHLRLYEYVLNNKQLCEVKRVAINVNEPLIAPSLGEALLLGAEEALAYDDDVD